MGKYGKTKRVDGIVYGDFHKYGNGERTCSVVKVKRLKKKGLFSFKGSLIIPESIRYKGEDYNVTGILTEYTTDWNVSWVRKVDRRYSKGYREESRYSYNTHKNDPLDKINPNNIISIKFPTRFRNFFLLLNKCANVKEIDLSNRTVLKGEFKYVDFKFMPHFKIPEGITEIGYESFANCKNLKSIKIPEGVTKIYDRAFKDCWSLEIVEIPNSVTSIDSCAFIGCDSIKKIIIDNDKSVNFSYLVRREIDRGSYRIIDRDFEIQYLRTEPSKSAK